MMFDALLLEGPEPHSVEGMHSAQGSKEQGHFGLHGHGTSRKLKLHRG